MPTLIAKCLAWIVRTLAMLLLIVGVLVAIAWIKAEWDRMDAIEQDIARKENALVEQRAQLASLKDELAEEDEAWRAHLDELRVTMQAELAQLNARVERAKPAWDRALAHSQNVKTLASDARGKADRARARVKALERQINWWDQFVNPGKLVELEIAKANYAALDRAAVYTEVVRDRVASTLESSPVQRLIDESRRKNQLIANLDKSESPESAALREKSQGKEREIGDVEKQIDAQRQQVANDPASRLLSAVKANLPTALLILIGVLLAPFIVRTFLYFVLAPAASRLPPISILPNAAAPPIPEPTPSGVSVPIDIGPDEALLVQSDYLQSSSLPARKYTVWFLNPRIPFTSIASGMFALTCIQPEGAAPTRAVVSSQKDIFGEVGVIEIPAGAAMVVQPRSLTGVVKQASLPVAITRHWRLLSLHAWLTFQFRYLAFHGPCKLILKGCRGVRSEEPRANQPRLINQAATIGFSANLNYKTTRCETFVSYLRGKENLFNDLFAGGPGRFIYEEVPSEAGKTGIAGRGLEGFVDAVLKAFGI